VFHDGGSTRDDGTLIAAVRRQLGTVMSPSPQKEGATMTFGKCVWDGCTRHAEKLATNACRSHHILIRDIRCQSCQGPLASRAELENRRCRRCSVLRAA
jgi:hypothetical protein